MFDVNSYDLIQQILLYLINIIATLLILWVYFADPKNAVNRSFSLLTIFLLFWIDGGYFFASSGDPSQALFLGRLILGEVFVFLALLYLFLKYFPVKTEASLLLDGFIFLLSIIVFALTTFTALIVEDVKVTAWGVNPIYHPMGKIVFYGLVIFIAFLILSRLFSKYFKLPQDKRLKVQYFLIGTFIFILMNLVFNVVFPLWRGSIKYWQLGNYSAIFLLGFTAYAIVKRELFGIKVVLTTLLVGSIAVLLALDLLVFTPQLLFKLYKGLVFVIFIYFGYLLIRSVLKEIEMREKIKRAYDIEKKARKQIEELTEAKTQFIMATQHHLRTPLTSMIGFLDLLFGGTYGKVPVKIKQALLKFESSTKRLIRVVDELLDISQFQLGKEVVSLEPGTDVLPILKEVIEELQFEVEYRNLYLKLEKPALRGPQGKLPKIKADSEKLKVALFNIVDNAIKYTRKGGVIVNVKSQMSNVKRKQGSLLITIKDTGIGIAKGEADKLFKEAFERGKTAKKVHGFGRGIGLFVTGHIIRAHHGKIWAESEGEGKGSTFFIELPIG